MDPRARTDIATRSPFYAVIKSFSRTWSDSIAYIVRIRVESLSGNVPHFVQGTEPWLSHVFISSGSSFFFVQQSLTISPCRFATFQTRWHRFFFLNIWFKNNVRPMAFRPWSTWGTRSSPVGLIHRSPVSRFAAAPDAVRSFFFRWRSLLNCFWSTPRPPFGDCATSTMKHRFFFFPRHCYRVVPSFLFFSQWFVFYTCWPRDRCRFLPFYQKKSRCNLNGKELFRDTTRFHVFFMKINHQLPPGRNHDFLGSWIRVWVRRS